MADNPRSHSYMCSHVGKSMLKWIYSVKPSPSFCLSWSYFLRWHQQCEVLSFSVLCNPPSSILIDWPRLICCDFHRRTLERDIATISLITYAAIFTTNMKYMFIVKCAIVHIFWIGWFQVGGVTCHWMFSLATHPPLKLRLSRFFDWKGRQRGRHRQRGRRRWERGRPCW